MSSILFPPILGRLCICIMKKRKFMPKELKKNVHAKSLYNAVIFFQSKHFLETYNSRCWQSAPQRDTVPSFQAYDVCPREEKGSTPKGRAKLVRLNYGWVVAEKRKEKAKMLIALLHPFLLPWHHWVLASQPKALGFVGLFSYSSPHNNLLLNDTKVDSRLNPLLPSRGTLDTSSVHLQVKCTLCSLTF